MSCTWILSKIFHTNQLMIIYLKKQFVFWWNIYEYSSVYVLSNMAYIMNWGRIILFWRWAPGVLIPICPEGFLSSRCLAARFLLLQLFSLFFLIFHASLYTHVDVWVAVVTIGQNQQGILKPASHRLWLQKSVHDAAKCENKRVYSHPQKKLHVLSKISFDKQ